MPASAELYLGLISGTSADAIDVALVSFDPVPRLVAACATPYPAALRPRVLALARETAEINLDEADFDWATGKLMERAERFCDHRLVSVLEGGYDLEGLSQSASTHITRLLKG